MIVVAIIAILAAIALPAYQDYVIRAQASEGAVLADGAKTAVAEFYSNTGRPPADNASAGLAGIYSITGKFVLGLQVFNGVVAVGYGSASPYRANAALNGKVLVFSPTFSGGSTTWTCTGNFTGLLGPQAIPQKYLPVICRTGSN
jgi:type IV pilus assembly protein PilA